MTKSPTGDPVEGKPPDSKQNTETSPSNIRKTFAILDESKPKPVRSNARVGFRVDRTESSFQVQKNLHPFLESLWKAEPSIRILPTTPNLPELSNPQSIPKNVKSLSSYFTIVEEKLPNAPKRVYINFKLLAPTTISNLKRNHPFLLQYIQTQHIHFIHDILAATQHASIGYIFNLHPKITWIPDLHDEISKQLTAIAIQNYSTDYEPLFPTNNPTKTPQIPAFKIESTPIYHGTGPTLIQTLALGIRCAKPQAELLTTLLTEIEFPRGIFIPHGTIPIIGQNEYRTLLQNQNQLLHSTRLITLTGITEQLMLHTNIPPQTISPTQTEPIQSLISTLQLEPTITAIEKTSTTTTLGRWFIVTNIRDLPHTRKIIDDSFLPNITLLPSKLKQSQINLQMKPRRADQLRLSNRTTTYAQRLRQNILTMPTHLDNTPDTTRPPRRNPKLTFIYDEDFPLLAAQTPNNNTTTLPSPKAPITNPYPKPKTPVVLTASITPSPTQTQPTPPTPTSTPPPINLEDLTTTILQKIKDDLNHMIEEKIKTEIATVIHPMKSEMNEGFSTLANQFEQLTASMNQLMQIQLLQHASDDITSRETFEIDPPTPFQIDTKVTAKRDLPSPAITPSRSPHKKKQQITQL
jgi:hypothetical protein